MKAPSLGPRSAADDHPSGEPISAVADVVGERFGVTVTTTSTPVGLLVDDLVRLALRRNPRRAHLLVSTVLGKHLAVDPRRAIDAGHLLGALVAGKLTEIPGLTAPSTAGTGSLDEAATGDSPFGGQVLGLAHAELTAAARESLVGDRPGALALVLPRPPEQPQPIIVLGYAETATALGQLVAEQLHAQYYLHSTRRDAEPDKVFARFQESHSHATSHLLVPDDPVPLLTPHPLVLVDDEISTGRTALATIAVLHRSTPRKRYVIASLVDLRSDRDRAAIADLARSLGARIDVVALVSGRVHLPADLADRAGAWIATTAADAAGPAPSARASEVTPELIEIDWPPGVAEGGAHGIDAPSAATMATGVDGVANRLHRAVASPLALPDRPARWLVVGSEEFMFLPLQVAAALAGRLSVGTIADDVPEVRFQSTSRSPVHPIQPIQPNSGDGPGGPDSYPITRGFRFDATDGTGPEPRYLYNANWSGPAGLADPDLVLLIVDAAHDPVALLAPGGPAQVLAGAGLRVVVVRVAAGTEPALPPPLRGPEFGSYQPDEVGWLVTDLSDLELEGDVRQRELQIQAGTAHYAESLPREYLPARAYRELFDQVLAESAARLATAVGVVTELVLAERGTRVVLASLARAGTPVAILLRRWAAHHHGLELPHYAVSIVRGRGIDVVALEYLARHHEPADVVFVDGWTGKGAIARELSAALTQVRRSHGLGFRDDLAVLADPGHCVRTFGTRDDFLIASACLNSTVSGLVSRTVLNRTYLRPDQFHGAKFYADLAADDMSAMLLDAVSACFDQVTDAVIRDLAEVRNGDRRPTFSGWAALEEIRAEYGIDSLNFVKPGVGETTRVLLRRVPWRILLRENDNPDHRHLRLLAADRQVPIEIRPDLPYSCVGLIRPISAQDQGEG